MACLFQCWKNSTFLLDRPNNTDDINVKMDGSALKEKPCFKMLGCLSVLSSNRDFTLFLILKLPPKIGVLIRSIHPSFLIRSFFFLRLVCISINLPYCLAWNIVVISWLELLTAKVR